MFSSDRLQNLRRALAGREMLVAAAVAAVAVLLFTGLFLLLSGDRVPDFRQYEAGAERKVRFFEFLRPIIEAENTRVLEERRRLEELAAEDGLGWLDRRWLHGLAEDYGLDPQEYEDDTLIMALLRRVDVVPVSLALAQAAKESGWGTSRFARKGNNFFGEWCYDAGCGLVPRARAAERSHEVRAFDSPRESVASYLRNINTNRSYRELRRVRAGLRAQGRPLSGLVLAEQLQRYSERGQAYVDEIKGLIRYNDLEQTGA
ncbi:glucosaminidase domain-containing protein [Lentisalinibacter salinarum]|uniref:glucosaminidase domain-containing protein n=1 Tax=Lentisalinibacter salinarum TaxID=2992239 RepID=UPI0038674875